MKPKLYSIISLLVLFTFTACEIEKNKTISISNTSNFNYKSKVIEISWEQLKKYYTGVDSVNFKIVDVVTNKQIPFQLEYIGDTLIHNVLVQLDLKAGETSELLILDEKPTQIKTKTYGRYVPERLDDFAWENDKIAYRMYGKALEVQGKGNAYGTDVWVKSTDKLVIDDRYKRGNYHKDHGDGMDYYHVGFTLGAGNIAPYKNDSIWYSKNYYKYKILDNGPLRTTFKLEFESWLVAGESVTATKTISLDAGNQLNKIAVSYTFDNEAKHTAVIGIIKRSGDGGKELLNINDGILSYWEPTHGDDGTTGVGVIIPSKVNDMKIRYNQFLAEVDVINNEPFIYYTGAVWDKAGEITNNKQWVSYLEAKKEELLNPGIDVSFEAE
ncbi:DUF4861 domain-containing protein [Lutibacter sp. A80]|uniref:DUF4861 family protein n=1 Tax=Lutibacter sp. A80 TaxID=2918453 RepID=UPI001F0530B0|nr:DUF4861 family protein [Lutibacter sp. A80]UMB61858.1 DUF4861 domain-containing protein [Lutibacter sp. A80]